MGSKSRHSHIAILAIATALMFCSLCGHAQVRFKVLAVRGKVMIGNVQATLGKQLSESEKIVVPNNGYVSLAHVNGKIVELKKSGAYSIAELNKAAGRKTGSATDKFAAYVFSELTEVNEPISFSDNQRANMSTTGSVDRAAGNDVQAVDSILALVGGPGELRALAVVQEKGVESGAVLSVIMPRTTRLMSDSVEFVWHRSPRAASVTLVVLDQNNNVVFKRTTNDTALRIHLANEGIKEGELYYWHIEGGSDKSYRSDEYCLYPLPLSERTEVNTLLSSIRSEVDADESAIGSLILASIYEDRGLMYDAHRAYINALRLAPDIQNYKRMFAEFLRRQSLNLEAYLVYR